MKPTEGTPFTTGSSPGALILILLAFLLSSCASLHVDEAAATAAPGPQNLSVQSQAGSRAGSPACGLAILVHGVDGSPDSWPKTLESHIRAVTDSRSRQGGAPVSWEVVRVDWREISSHKLTSPRNGYRLGRAIGTRLAEAARSYAILHLVAHSMGAHVIQGIADAYRPAHPDTVIHLTFLDAFVSRGLFSLAYGRRVFGRNSDFAESYVTRREPAFLTNALFRHAHNFDVTGIVPEERVGNGSYYHIWPIHYYLDSRRPPGGGVYLPGLSLAPYGFDPGRHQAAAAVTDALRTRYETLREQYPAGEVTIPQ